MLLSNWAKASIISVLNILASGAALGQQPVVTTVSNAASMSGGASPVIAPQMLVMVRGWNLAAETATADFPWPKQLAGVSMTFNGVPAALSFISPSQINAAVPSAMQGATSATIVVTADGRASPPITAAVAASAIGIFTQEQSGCGPLSAYNIHADGSTSMNTPQNSLDPLNDYGITIWLTGLGAFPDRSDGVPWHSALRTTC